jgi:hypothetical protein
MDYKDISLDFSESLEDPKVFNKYGTLISIFLDHAMRNVPTSYTVEYDDIQQTIWERVLKYKNKYNSSHASKLTYKSYIVNVIKFTIKEELNPYRELPFRMKKVFQAFYKFYKSNPEAQAEAAIAHVAKMSSKKWDCSKSVGKFHEAYLAGVRFTSLEEVDKSYTSDMLENGEYEINHIGDSHG